MEPDLSGEGRHNGGITAARIARAKLHSSLSAEAIKPHLERMANICGWLSMAEASMLAILAGSLESPSPIIVEIGSFQGKSAVMMAGANPRATVYCIDPFDDTLLPQYIDWRGRLGLKSLLEGFHLNTRDYPNIVPLKGFSLGILFDYWSHDRSPANRGIDMLFIDGDHSYDAVRADVEGWLPYLKPGGVLAMHDVNVPGDPIYQVTGLEGGWCPDPIRVVCDLGLGFKQNGWESCYRVETLFTARKESA